MKHILSAVKAQLVERLTNTENLVKKVTIAQEAYRGDTSNEFLFNNWMNAMEELSKNEQVIRHLKSAYRSMCSACEVEEQTVEDILQEAVAKQAKKAARKPRVKKSDKKEEGQ